MGICINKAKEIVDQLRIDDDKESLVYKAAVILIYGIANNTCNQYLIKVATGFKWTEVIVIFGNFNDNGIVYRKKWVVPIVENELQNVIQITLSAMVGAGELIRVMEESDESEEKYPHLKIA